MTTTLIDLHKKNIALRFPDLYERYQRLRGVGGFISILGSNPRVFLFCRYNHVQRVVMLTDILVNMLGLGQSQCIMFLAHFHDINRLPLTYVTEKALGYNQALNIRPYLSKCKDIISEEYICAMEAFMDKNINHSLDVRFVYISDMIVNFVEDLLFATILLNISSDCLPRDVLSATGFDDNEIELRDDIEFLKLYFANNSKNFSEYFHRTSLKYMIRFIERVGGTQILLSDVPIEKNMALMTVKRFLIKNIFPVVDEEIVKETSLVQKVVLPYYDSLKKAQINPYEKLWDITDRQFLDSAAGMGLIKCESISEFWPVLEPSKIIYSREL